MNKFYPVTVHTNKNYSDRRNEFVDLFIVVRKLTLVVHSLRSCSLFFLDCSLSGILGPSINENNPANRITILCKQTSTTQSNTKTVVM